MSRDQLYANLQAALSRQGESEGTTEMTIEQARNAFACHYCEAVTADECDCDRDEEDRSLDWEDWEL